MDAGTGYRHYTAGQIPIAQVIRRFRDLDMPLEEIQAVLSAPDLTARNERITAHLARLEDELTRTQRAVTSLRNLLRHQPLAEPRWGGRCSASGPPIRCLRLGGCPVPTP
ncbi:MerR family DNA-binding protein [Nocardia acidivorans]|uniref:MerR family DNA-binding protein n=1 Tax=Nocardia acidivorans TaxID=404580 RepID=UPI0008345981|nr:MerR family DNA-binding protein [Nocardia acidivorans]